MPKLVRQFGMLLALLLGTAAGAAAPDEYQVEAVFLLHFTQFVEWPAQSFSDPHTPFVIGVLGRDPFGSALDEAVRGESVNGRPLVVKRFADATDLRPCQILFIDRSAANDADHVIGALAHSGTLTVSNFDVPAPADVIIRFLNEDRRIRLRINVDYARNAGLTISSKLLRPAQVVGTVPAG
ncbi:MAG TPA: YfiR family protein [Steroidobacteraceae bacterium]|nr:YfiR family protein [Steroidobacteraceae bacterium]